MYRCMLLAEIELIYALTAYYPVADRMYLHKVFFISKALKQQYRSAKAIYSEFIFTSVTGPTPIGTKIFTTSLRP